MTRWIIGGVQKREPLRSLGRPESMNLTIKILLLHNNLGWR
jgi:hypothetical protein